MIIPDNQWQQSMATFSLKGKVLLVSFFLSVWGSNTRKGMLSYEHANGTQDPFTGNLQAKILNSKQMLDFRNIVLWGHYSLTVGQNKPSITGNFLKSILKDTCNLAQSMSHRQKGISVVLNCPNEQMLFLTGLKRSVQFHKKPNHVSTQRRRDRSFLTLFPYSKFGTCSVSSWACFRPSHCMNTQAIIIYWTSIVILLYSLLRC